MCIKITTKITMSNEFVTKRLVNSFRVRMRTCEDNSKKLSRKVTRSFIRFFDKRTIQLFVFDVDSTDFSVFVLEVVRLWRRP